ncbi:PAS domain-containing protein [Marinobacterium weihaiense]|uniref:PAS domain-containing protein n=1 Tax=Marinobacterium weihaiense TaxID=2851016 RepID=A0ABS6M6P6_9GAMM|nr:PAS domain-containing protein [Marinobacterium weihaiense]MBV0931955.1 PAS domain-containing protein [Marinobacterium weihaiense]
MKNKTSIITPRDNEHALQDDEFIVSKTNTQGIITYCNRTFMRISGFSEAELFGKPHNIIRHPDMPRGAFHLLWQRLKSGREFFGYVKNLCKDGSYYWVMANITPDINASGTLVGYYSVRRKPSAQAIRTITDIYQQMHAEEQRVGPQNGPQASVDLLMETCRAQGFDYDHFIMHLDQQ